MPLHFYLMRLLWLFIRVASARASVDCCPQMPAVIVYSIYFCVRCLFSLLTVYVTKLFLRGYVYDAFADYECDNYNSQ